jgi:hypothetical protein
MSMILFKKNHRYGNMDILQQTGSTGSSTRISNGLLHSYLQLLQRGRMQSRIMDRPLICHIIANNINQNGMLFLSTSWNFLIFSLKKWIRRSLPPGMTLQPTHQTTNPINKHTNKSLARDRALLHKTISM